MPDSGKSCVQYDLVIFICIEIWTYIYQWEIYISLCKLESL